MLLQLPFIILSACLAAQASVVSRDPLCDPYVGYFVKYGNQFGISSSTLEDFALRVSNCNPNAIGLNGEQGLMQLTQSLCQAAPNGNCLDLDYNVMTGARALAAQQ